MKDALACASVANVTRASLTASAEVGLSWKQQ